MTCANICLLAQIPCMKQIHTQQCTFEFKKMSTVLTFCKSCKKVPVKAAPRAQTSCRKVYRVTLR